MKIHIKGGRLIDPKNGIDRVQDVYIAAGKIAAIGEAPKSYSANRTIDATNLVVCPGLVGFDAMASLTMTPSLSLPLLSHPDFLGSHYVSPDSGIAPSILFGLLPRLAGADISIYPTFGLTYPISQGDCRQIAASCRRSLGSCPPIFQPRQGE